MQLAIDTSQGTCSAVLSQSSIILAKSVVEEQSKQAEMLIPMIQEMLIRRDIELRDIFSIACVVGPGSFTGIRIGLAAVMGMQIALDIPALGVSALELIAWYAYKELELKDQAICVVLNAARSQVFWQRFGPGGVHLSEMMVQDYAAAADAIGNDVTMVGAGTPLLASCMEAGYQPLDDTFLPHASLIPGMLNDTGWNVHYYPLEPLYLRDADVTKPKPR